MSKLMRCCSFDSSRQCGRGTDCISDLRSCKGQMACFSEIQQQRKASAALLKLRWGCARCDELLSMHSNC